MTKGFHWHSEDYFPYLIQTFKTAVLALEYLVDDLHVNKDLTIQKFLSHCGSEDFLWGIVKLMSCDSLRVSGNSAYVFGTIAETEEGIERIIDLLNNKSHPDSDRILLYLVNLLKSTDYECLMNAAGTIGTISESNSGRGWLISQPLLNDVIELSTNLLDNQNIWVSSNAALVIARISIEDSGCDKLLAHDLAEKILKKLIDSLGCDNAGRGMNCAFAIGRICDHENRRLTILRLTNVNRLIESLSSMIEQNADNGCTKNACFALSCLASNQHTHQIIVEHTCFQDLLNSLCKLLVTVKDAETQWFAAMLLRIFSSFPNGCAKMRGIEIIWSTLNDLIKNENLFNDVKEEIILTLETLKPLEKPHPVRVEVRSCSEVYCEWDEIKLKNKISIKYLLYKDNECVYNGIEKSFLVGNLEPFTQYLFRLQILAVESDEKSELSDSTEAITEESLPTPPTNLKAAAATTSLIRIVWEPPERMNGQLKCYFVHKDNTFLEQTNELSFILSGLLPGTAYEVSVCASTSKGKGEKATIKTSTCNLGDILPERPSFGMIGKREILVRWQPPQVITGKLNRYELIMNGKCVYSGIALEHQIGMLKPDAEYKFEIVAITTEGKCKSKVSKARTLKDEYDPDRLPLYPGNNQAQVALVKEKTEIIMEKKRNSISKEPAVKPTMPRRQKTKPNIKKEKEQLPTMVCEEFGINKKLSDPINNQTNTNSFLPPVTSPNQSAQENLRYGLFSDESSSYLTQSLQLYKSNYKSSDHINNNQAIVQKKTLINHPTNPNSRRNSQVSIGNYNYIHPTTFTFSIKELTPNFPILPLANHTQNNNNNNNTQNNKTNAQNASQIPSLFQFKNSQPNTPLNPNSKPNHINPTFTTNTLHQETKFNSKSAIDSKDEIPLQYYLLKKLNKEKNLNVQEDISPLLKPNNHNNNYVNSIDFLNQFSKLSK